MLFGTRLSQPVLLTGASGVVGRMLGTQVARDAGAKVEAAARNTKQNRILALLNERNGATIPEMMQATDWQQHSVRGFLAGTVKKKLGLALTSSKSDGELRRYRLETRRGR